MFRSRLRTTYATLGSLTLLALVALPAAAQDFGLSTLSGSQFGLRDDSPASFLGGTISVILGILGILLVGLLIFGGVMYMTSAGNSSRVEQGKDIITWAIIGIVVVLAAFIIARFVVGALITGQNTTTNVTPTNNLNPANETWCNPPPGFYCDYELGGAVRQDSITRRSGEVTNNTSSFRETTLPEKTDDLINGQ
ncbi:MAG: hypothetical protein KC925_02120 [Candidatus Doudnabacteria bacterium]|nr:hypothetical protein [Candidatus Doudnabacteria bacterium]MCA9387771.1 hypothetical protein [Candidatus Andersenbacteria bacterium]